jgi:hypothetical protein
LLTQLITIRFHMSLQLPPWSRVVFDKLIVTHLVKKFPAFCGTGTSITVFTRARHGFLPWAICIQSTTFHSISPRSILISSHLRLDLPSVFFFSVLKLCTYFSSLPCVLHAPSISSSLSRPPWWYLLTRTSYEAPHYAFLTRNGGIILRSQFEYSSSYFLLRILSLMLVLNKGKFWHLIYLCSQYRLFFHPPFQETALDDPWFFDP